MAATWRWYTGAAKLGGGSGGGGREWRQLGGGKRVPPSWEVAVVVTRVARWLAHLETGTGLAGWLALRITRLSDHCHKLFIKCFNEPGMPCYSQLLSACYYRNTE